MKMTEEEKKKKKGVAIVIAVTPHAPKKPEDTSKPDEKMEKAWVMMKDSARYHPELDEKPEEKTPEITSEMLEAFLDSLKDNPDPDAWMGDESPEHFERMKEHGFPKGNNPTSPFLDDEPEEEDDPMEPWMDEPMKKAWFILKRRAWSNKIMPALGISPKEHEQRMLNEMMADGREEAQQGRYQRGELPKHMINTEEQQENEEFFADDLDMPEIDDEDPFVSNTSSTRRVKPEDYHPDPDEMYEMFRQD